MKKMSTIATELEEVQGRFEEAQRLLLSYSSGINDKNQLWNRDIIAASVSAISSHLGTLCSDLDGSVKDLYNSIRAMKDDNNE